MILLYIASVVCINVSIDYCGGILEFFYFFMISLCTRLDSLYQLVLF